MRKSKLLFVFFAIFLIYSCSTVNDHLNEQVEQGKSAKYILFSNLVKKSKEYDSFAKKDQDYFTALSLAFGKICHREPCPPPCPEGMNFVDDCMPAPWRNVGLYVANDITIDQVVATIEGTDRPMINVKREILKGDFDYVKLLSKEEFKSATSVRVHFHNPKNGISNSVSLK